MKKYLFICILFASCNRKLPHVIYKDTVVTHTDTITVNSHSTDTIPCDNFTYKVTNTIDTVYVSVQNKQLSVKYIKKTDTIFRDVMIVQPAPLRQVTKIDNSIKNKATKGSAIGDGNTITTKKNNWWWIFLAGMLSWFIIQNILYRALKTYIPFLNF